MFWSFARAVLERGLSIQSGEISMFLQSVFSVFTKWRRLLIGLFLLTSVGDVSRRAMGKALYGLK